MATYTVKQGDSLSKISERFYGNWSGVNSIAKANGITNVNLIYPGQSLFIPDQSSVTNADSDVVEDAHVVKSDLVNPWPVPWYIWASGAALLAGGVYLYYKNDKKKKKKDE